MFTEQDKKLTQDFSRLVQLAKEVEYLEDRNAKLEIIKSNYSNLEKEKRNLEKNFEQIKRFLKIAGIEVCENCCGEGGFSGEYGGVECENCNAQGFIKLTN